MGHGPTWFDGMTLVEVFALMFDEDVVLSKAARIEFVHRVGRDVRTWIVARVGRCLGPEAAEETEQDVWERVFRYPEAGRDRIDAELFGWLFELTRNACNTTFRKELDRINRRAGIEQAMSVPADDERERERYALYCALVELAAKHPAEYELILGRFFHELSWKDMAATFGFRSEYFAAQAVRRAIRILQEILETYV